MYIRACTQRITRNPRRSSAAAAISIVETFRSRSLDDDGYHYHTLVVVQQRVPQQLDGRSSVFFVFVQIVQANDDLVRSSESARV